MVNTAADGQPLAFERSSEGLQVPLPDSLANSFACALDSPNATDLSLVSATRSRLPRGAFATARGGPLSGL
jgi:hypothetical protein